MSAARPLRREASDYLRLARSVTSDEARVAAVMASLAWQRLDSAPTRHVDQITERRYASAWRASADADLASVGARS